MREIYFTTEKPVSG